MAAEGHRAIVGFKHHLQKITPGYTEGNVEVTASLIEQQDVLKLPIILDTSDANVFKVIPFWENAGFSREQFREMGLWGSYSTGYNYRFEYSESEKTLTIFDGSKKIIIFR